MAWPLLLNCNLPSSLHYRNAQRERNCWRRNYNTFSPAEQQQQHFPQGTGSSLCRYSSGDGGSAAAARHHPLQARELVISRAESGAGDAAPSTSTTMSQVSDKVVAVLHLGVSLGLLLLLDTSLKKAFTAASIKFPSALFGMFCIFSVLTATDVVAPSVAARMVAFFEPATTFIQRWLPLFYVPSLVVIPLAIQGIPPSAGAKIVAIIAGGWIATLIVAGYTAVSIRRVVRTKMEPAEPTPKPAPFTNREVTAWTFVLATSFVLAVSRPDAFGTFAATALPFLLASTVIGYIVGSSLPTGVRKVLHPIVCCALAADLGAFLLGLSTSRGLDAVLGAYLTKSPSNIGAGDLLMSFLGCVILSFAFSMFRQRKLVKRHAAEIFTSVIAASLFSLYSTAAVGRASGLASEFTRAVVPRCVTVALALPISSLLQAPNSSLTAAAVVLTGLVGANFAQSVMDKLGLDDPIARGIATASSAHGLGTAALSAKEPEALPFCAIAYALTGIFSSILCSIPVVQQSLMLIAG